MLQYENNTNTNSNSKRNNYSSNINNSNGPQKASLFSNLIVYQHQLFHSTIYDGKSVIVPQDEATIGHIKKILTKTIDSIIIVLDKDHPHSHHHHHNSNNNQSVINKDKFNIISKYGFELIYYDSFKINVPIYFVKGEDYSKLIKSVGNNVPPEQRDEYKLIVSSGIPNSIINPFAFNFQGILRGDPDQLKQDQYFTPTIVILGSYDSFHMIPALSGEFANNGNAFVVFELARIFSKLYSSKSTQGLYNIVFALTSVSNLNEYGVKRWIEQQPNLISETIEFVLCIDSIGIGNRYNDEEDDDDIINDSTLYLHMSRSPKLSNSLIETFKSAGINQGKGYVQTQINVVHRKINLLDKKNYWKHEVLAKKKIFSFTITQRPSPVILSKESTILQDFGSSSQTLDLKILKKNTRIIASALVAHIYNNSKIADYSDLLKDSLDVNLNSFESWKQVFSTTNLVFPFMQEKREPIGLSNLFSSPQQKYSYSSAIDDRLNNNRVNIINGIHSIFSTYLQELKMDKFNTDNSLLLYQPTQEILKFYRVKSFSFDFFHLNISIIYLTILYFIIKGSFKSFILNIIYNSHNNNRN